MRLKGLKKGQGWLLTITLGSRINEKDAEASIPKITGKKKPLD